MNRLYFGDNLAWLRNRDEFPNESVDLVYLDPPFNSNADYNVLFRETSGEVSQAQFQGRRKSIMANESSRAAPDSRQLNID